MGVFNNEDVVFGKMKAGQNVTTHVYHEPTFQNVPQKEIHPVFKGLAILAGLLFIVSLSGLDYRGIMLMGKFYFLCKITSYKYNKIFIITN